MGPPSTLRSACAGARRVGGGAPQSSPARSALSCHPPEERFRLPARARGASPAAWREHPCEGPRLGVVGWPTSSSDQRARVSRARPMPPSGDRSTGTRPTSQTHRRPAETSMSRRSRSWPASRDRRVSTSRVPAEWRGPRPEASSSPKKPLMSFGRSCGLYVSEDFGRGAHSWSSSQGTSPSTPSTSALSAGRRMRPSNLPHQRPGQRANARRVRSRERHRRATVVRTRQRVGHGQALGTVRVGGGHAGARPRRSRAGGRLRTRRGRIAGLRAADQRTDHRDRSLEEDD